MSLMHLNRSRGRFEIDHRTEPELFRDIYPYKNICRTSFDDSFSMPRPADPMYITDTTFRDGQQARPPYTLEQISHIFDLLHKLGGHSGLIRQSEFFLYSEKDRKAVEQCLAKGYRYPEITGWIRATEDDLKLVKDMGLKETGILTSVSDYHIFLKLGKDREKTAEGYLRVVEKALEWGIIPRCHFEDITRADIYGFCIPLAQKLMALSKESGLPVKIRLCDTMGYAVPYPGASLPRCTAKIVRAFTDDAEVPGHWLEWHGHNDFHKALVNTVMAWLYGCSGANATLLGFGERTGNAPVEALAIEYISLTGEDDAAATQTIAEIADYFENVLGYAIPDNYPFVGKDFNATKAGVHVDGLLKNEEIYNIFDTRQILGKPVSIIITDKSGRAGVAYWINNRFGLRGTQQVDKRHPAVGKIHNRIIKAYEEGRTTSFSNQEMWNLVKRHLPQLFSSEFDQLKKTAHTLSSRIMRKLSENMEIKSLEPKRVLAAIDTVLEKYSFIQYLYMVDTKGRLVTGSISHPEDKSKYKAYDPGKDLSDREWFTAPMQTGKLNITDFYRSFITGKLCLTVSMPVFDANDDIQAILGADIRFEELLKRRSELEEEEGDAPA